MDKFRKVGILCLTIIMLLSTALFVACGESGDNGGEFDIKSVYRLYTAYAEEKGETPLTYDEWLASVKGSTGENGKSAYELAVESGYSGTFQQWIEYLDGRKFSFIFLSFNDAEYTYDGLAKSITVQGVPNGATIEYEPKNTYTEVGEYPITATVKADGVEDVTLTATLKIKYSEEYLLKSEIEDLLKTLRGEVDATVSNSQTMIATLRSEYENKVNELESKAASDKQELLNKLNGDKAALQQGIDILTSELDEKSEEFESAVEELESDYNSKVAAVSTALTSAKAELQTALNTQVEALNTAINNAKASLVSATADLESAISVLDNKYQTKVGDINALIIALQTENANNKARITELENNIAALLEINYFTVSFDSDGGTEIPAQTVADGKKAIKPDDPEKDGCVFKGWFVGDEQWNFLYCNVVDDTVLQAKWIEVDYETTTGDKDDIEVELANNEITLTATHKNGYTWLGWYDGEEKVSKGNSYSISFKQNEVNHLYTARFAKITVKQNVVAAGTITELNGKYFYGDMTTLKTTVNNGYVFKGWYKNGEKVSLDGELEYELIFGTENETYTATYIANPVSITKNIAAAGTVEKETVGVIGGDYTITATTNSGYTWLGWYSGDEKVSVGDSLTYTFALTETPITYTAKWAEYKVSLSKNYDKAGTITGSGSKTAGDNVSVSATNDYSEYFSFDGWYSGSEKVSSSANYTFEMPNNSLSLTAKWNLKSGVEAITTASQLNAIDGTKTYILLNDISLSGSTFTPIECLNGVFDGLNNSIKNIKMTSVNADCRGMFTTNAGMIKNLTIDGASVSGHCVFVGTNNGLIKNCAVINSTLDMENKTNLGGYAIFTIINNGTIYNCKSESIMNGPTTGSYDDVGGFVCKNYNTIKYCYSTDIINLSKAPYQSEIGAFCLYCAKDGIIDSCYSGTNILGEKYCWKNAFGRFGENSNDNSTTYSGTIKNCFYTGTMDITGTNSYLPRFARFLIVENCYATFSALSGTDVNFTTFINITNSNYLKNTVKFREYGQGSIDDGYVWVFEEGKLPKLYWE